MYNPLLTVRHLKKSYGTTLVVDGLSFEVGQGESVGLLGPNGAGKTTIFYMTMGLLPPDSGEIFFRGKNITGLPIHERALLGMGYLAQEPSIFASLSVADNIRLVLETLSLSTTEQKKRLNHLLSELNLESLAEQKAGTLSGGQRRRLEITRALVTSPSLLLLDEPFANIDPITIADLKKSIRHLQNKGISILITDHNAREMFSVVDRSYLIRNGGLLTSGTVDQLLHHPEARTSYFGEDFTL